MTSRDVVVVVEGGSDLSIFDKICHFALSGRWEYVLLRASDFKGIADGKKGVLDLFSTATSRGELPKVMMLVDKDVDDYRSAMVQHSNLFYTTHYNIENELIAGSDLIASLSIVCNETQKTVREWIVASPGVVEDLPKPYLSWVAFCMVVRIHAPNATCGNFGVARPVFGNCSAKNLFRNKKAKGLCRHVKNVMSVTCLEFVQKFQAMEAEVFRRFNDGDINVVFNGKWYFPLLVDWIASLGVVSKNNRSGLERRLRDVMVANFKDSAPLVHRFREQVELVV